MRVLQLISSGGNYGAEKVVANLALGLRSLQCEVVIGVFHNAHKPNLQLARAAERMGLKVRVFPCSGKLDYRTVREISTFLTEFEPDILHTHGYKADIYGYWASRNLNISRVASCHSLLPPNERIRLYSIIDRLALSRFEAVVAVSDKIAGGLKCCLRPNADRVVTIPNGIDVESFRSAAPTLRNELEHANKIVGMVARLCPEKGPQNFLRAARAVLDQIPDTIFAFVGDGPMMQELKHTAERLGIQENVRFTGFRDDMSGVYRSLDLMVLPSLNEGLPMAVLEAMASGTTVVATRVGGVPSLVSNWQTGVLVDAGDIDSLSGVIIRLLQSEALRKEIGERAQASVSIRYGAPVMARRYLELYQRTLGVEVNDSVSTLPVLCDGRSL
jgi:glycosyltransferase involved in cell wall biosynthesis